MKRNIIAYYDMLRITENVISDIPLPIVSDLNFFYLRLLYFYLAKSIYKKRDIQTLDSVAGVKETPQGFFIGQDLGANIARRLDRTIII